MGDCGKDQQVLEEPHVLFWGGLGDALALALVLALPDNMPERGEIVVTAFAVVAFSIFVQGISMPLLVRRLGLLQGDVPESEASAAE